MQSKYGWQDWGYQSYVPNPEDGMEEDRRQMQEELEYSRADDDHDILHESED